MSRYFPLFVNLEGREILVFGAGRIAGRRVRALLEFGVKLTVVAPEAVKEIEEFAKAGRIVWEKRVYLPGEVKKWQEAVEKDADAVCGIGFVLAATDRAEINRQIWEECKEAGVPVNVSSEKERCDFYFPGLAVSGDTVVGVTAGGSDHSRARELTEKIRKEVMEKWK